MRRCQHSLPYVNGLTSSRRPHSLVIVCVDHKDGKATGFRKIFHNTRLEPDMVYYRPFLHGDYVGMISFNRLGGNIKISVFNAKLNESVVIPTNLPLVLVSTMTPLWISLMVYPISS